MEGALIGSGDVGILNYAYALEQLEAAFYTQVAASFYAGITTEEQQILTDIKNHEVIHRDYLKAALGSQAIADLSVDFSSIDFAGRTNVLDGRPGPSRIWASLPTMARAT